MIESLVKKRRLQTNVLEKVIFQSLNRFHLCTCNIGESRDRLGLDKNFRICLVITPVGWIDFTGRLKVESTQQMT